MVTDLTFETRVVLLALRQVGTAEQAPTITLQLKLTSTPNVYTSDSRLEHAKWTMVVREIDTAWGEDGYELGTLTYTHTEDKPECTIVVNQSTSRFLTLLEMFKGGYASEITICLEEIEGMADYSR